MYCTLSTSVAVGDVSCAGADDGSVTVLASGALPDSSALVYTLLPLDIQQPDSIFTGLSGGLYEVVVADEMGCVDTLSFEISEPEPLIVVVDQVVGSPENEEAGSIDVSVSGGSEPYAFAWTGLEGAFASDQEDVDGLNPGTYEVEVTDANGCSIQLTDIVVETIVGITEFADEWGIRVYPNPAVDWVTVELPVVNAALTVELYDAMGRLIWQQTAASNGRSQMIPVGNCAAGHYVIRVSDGTLVRNEKLLVNP
jgi:hypothetical protein